MTVWRPVPTDFWEAPYCATLFVIDYALEVLTCALAAEHPGVLDIVPPEDLDLPVADLLAIKIAITSEQLRGSSTPTARLSRQGTASLT
jgi:hypothetical protein